MRNKKLGRGLDYLLSSQEKPTEGHAARPLEQTLGPGDAVPARVAPTFELDLALIQPNPYQPRADFDEAGLEQLADSIRQQGVLQPILVRRAAQGYELVAGERRLRAARMAGLTRVPALCREVNDGDMRLLALVENLHRSDLNPIEKAHCFEAMARDAGLNQVEIAKAVGLERSSVANYLRLLDLPESLQRALVASKLSMGQARAILAAPADRREALALEVMRDSLSVRATERLARQLVTRPAGNRDRRTTRGKAAWARDMEEQLCMALGCKVAVSLRSGRGRVVLEVGGREDFDRIYELLMSVHPHRSEEELIERRTRAAPKP